MVVRGYMSICRVKSERIKRSGAYLGFSDIEERW